jgi:LysM repeat protein
MTASNRCGFALTLALVGMLILAACVPSRPHPTATSTVPGKLTPYSSPTPSQTPRASPQPSGSPPPLPTATSTITPTPFLHVLAKDDTLLGLALKYGVSLETIKTANPELQPNFLIVGTSVIIPIQATSAPTSVPTPTPVPVRMAAPRCYPTADGGLWCFVLAANDQLFGLENLSAWITLGDPRGQILAGQEAIAPLNRLPPGATLPLMAFFPPPVSTDAVPDARLTNSLVIPAQDTRYLTATVQVESVEILTGGLQATVQGNVLLPAGTRPASVVWVAAVAYDAAGQVVGVRKWEAAESLQPAGRLPFAFTVYSLGPAIARVEAVVEARP